MSHSSMSINQIIQQTNSPPSPSINENKLTGKVKIFYTFKGSDKHCLCTFDLKLSEYKDKKWISVPLKQCLFSVCSSCPDQLMNNNTAIYSANFEESKTVENWSPLHDSQSNIIWEGHGLLSSILNDEHPSSKAQITGKIVSDASISSDKYDCIIEVLIQLHPVRHSPLLQHNEPQQQQQQYLPPMRSIWSESMNNNYSPPYNNNNNSSSSTTTTSPTLMLERPSYHHQRPNNHLLSPPRQQQIHLLQPPSNSPNGREDRLSPLSSPSIPRDMKEDHHHKMYNNNNSPIDSSHSSWSEQQQQQQQQRQNYDPQDMTKKRKLSSNSAISTTTAAIADLRHYTNNNNTHNNTHNNKMIHRNNNSSLTSATATLVSTSPTTDTYYHQSRRKKRDTKPPNANDIRPFIEIEKTKDGQYVLPAEVDSWTVLDLGSVIWDRAAFHNQRYIYPVGYRVKKWYRSMVDPHSDTQYTCEILDGGDEPIFQLNADDNPSECWRGPTPTTVWTIAVRRAFAIRNMDYGHNPVGPDFFGLRKNTIAKMIQDLPNADKCKNYIWQNFEAMSNNKGKSVRRSNTRLGSSSSSTGSNQQQPTIDNRLTASPPIKSEG